MASLLIIGASEVTSVEAVFARPLCTQSWHCLDMHSNWIKLHHCRVSKQNRTLMQPAWRHIPKICVCRYASLHCDIDMPRLWQTAVKYVSYVTHRLSLLIYDMLINYFLQIYFLQQRPVFRLFLTNRWWLGRSWYFSGFGTWGVNQPLGSLPFLFPFLPFPSLPPFPSPPLEVGPLKSS